MTGRQKNYEDNKKRYDLLRKSGVCVVCGINPATSAPAIGKKILKYCEGCRRKDLDSKNSNRAQMKIEVLSHYGKDGHLLCCWPDCTAIDPDYLTIDHMDNSGAEERKKDRTHAGMTLYAILKRTGYPKGFQTLCHNHQWKKELMRRRDSDK
jgi:hypothetical protein